MGERGMFDKDLFKGKKILITGGGTGLGKGMAERLLGLGAEIAICGRRKAVCEATAGELMKTHGGVVKAYGVDIRDAGAVDAMVEEIFREGPLTSLVNNAAGNFIARTQDLSPRGFDAIANIVMHGTFYVTQAVGKRWIAGKHKGSVVSIIVTWTRNGGPFVVPSTMSKAAVEAMTKSLASEWGPFGIRLNAIAPGEIPTEGMSKRLSPQGDSGMGTAAVNPVRPLWAHGGTAESRGLPALRRLRMADRRDDRHGRRAGARRPGAISINCANGATPNGRPRARRSRRRTPRIRRDEGRASASGILRPCQSRPIGRGTGRGVARSGLGEQSVGNEGATAFRRFCAPSPSGGPGFSSCWPTRTPAMW